MGVYLCLGTPIYKKSHHDSIPLSDFNSYQDIHLHMSKHNSIFVFLGDGIHKIKKKAEQIACEDAIRKLRRF